MDINHSVSHRGRNSSSFLSLFYGVDGVLTISECGEHEVGVLDPCFFPFQSCLLRALNLSDKPSYKEK